LGNSYFREAYFLCTFAVPAEITLLEFAALQGINKCVSLLLFVLSDGQSYPNSRLEDKRRTDNEKQRWI